ncbi:50S ribosomal protein L23 [wastewater metagenome]|uniref:Large ribosomal subunit protein uL23m n=2 Tax=unclassified sequences TaxID=12908 RepID=A0A5B8R8D9_9ZZZZ|nr:MULTISPECIES: 50S ribosomal protein L23 [Arhodomonas]MCS4504091.1 50S ribosomal protein L23 [Arhodomonas aquaeolei]QEA04268.1 50S ribosomal protein L23 [uncultured organism]
MNPERIYQVLLGPHISEKSTLVADDGEQVVFRVARDASKPEIRKAVEQLFEVRVRDVRVVNVSGKNKGFGRIRGRRPDWKKAYVALEAGQELDFLEAAE